MSMYEHYGSGSVTRTGQKARALPHSGNGAIALKILLADDHDLVRETIASYLVSEGRADVVSVGDYVTAKQKVGEGDPFDLVLLDFNMPGMNGLEGLSRILKSHPDQSVAIISGTATNKTAKEAVEMGAIGFLPKTLGAKSLINAIKFMVAGETFVPASVLNGTDEGQESTFLKQFSQREREVLQGLCKGHANKEIARDLDLQEVTIKLHVRTLCKKLGAKNRTQAALIARDAGF